MNNFLFIPTRNRYLNSKIQGYFTWSYEDAAGKINKTKSEGIFFSF